MINKGISSFNPKSKAILITEQFSVQLLFGTAVDALFGDLA